MKLTTRCLATALFLAVLSVPSAASAGPRIPLAGCAQPTVNVLVKAESAVSRPVIASPSEYGLSNVYSQISQATKPLFTYAEAGPQFLGPFEALTPAGTPPPPRAVSAYPSDDIPDHATSSWGGESRTDVSPITASAASSGARKLGVGGVTSDGSRSWATSVVECDVVTVIAGWAASNVVFAPGVTADQIGETITLVVGPKGSSAKVDVTLTGLSGVEPVPVAGRPADPFTDPTREGGGPRIEAGEPRTHADNKGATASGGGFNFLLTDPKTGQGAGYRIGSVNADIKVLGALSFEHPDTVEGGGTGRPPTQPPITDSKTPTVVGREVAGSPPPPSKQAEAIANTVLNTATIAAITVTTRSWYWLFAVLATLAVLGALGLTGELAPERFPTLHWVVRQGDRVRRRFAAVYLKW